jgi:glycosyltransferase involved in cell wall biosynthesis
MKVFMIAEYFWPGIGGLENSTARLAGALQAHHEPEVLTPAPADSFDDATPFPVRRFPVQDGPPYAAMWEYIAGYARPLAACFFGFSDAWTDAHLQFLARVRHERAQKVLVKIPTMREFSLYVSDEKRQEHLLAADYLICPNPAIQRDLAQAGIPPEKTIYCPNGVPEDQFVPATPLHKMHLREELGLDVDRPVFCFTGRFAERKRVDLLVEAFRRVPEADLVLVGYFDNRFDAGSSFDVSQNSNVYLFGPTYDVLPYLQASDVFISASRAEGMSNAMLEGLSCGLPALVTAIPGHEEVIEPGVNGQLFVRDDAEDLAARARWFLDHRDRLPALSASARETVVSRFTIESVAATYHSLLTGGVG